ncbi:hypothetical protein CDD83_4866 [Cordyceps sp. RAO-2017]|nr:hypothetical protein CDD83_4866 [Cordyceps sp. RAO-2017]
MGLLLATVFLGADAEALELIADTVHGQHGRARSTVLIPHADRDTEVLDSVSSVLVISKGSREMIVLERLQILLQGALIEWPCSSTSTVIAFLAAIASTADHVHRGEVPGAQGKPLPFAQLRCLHTLRSTLFWKTAASEGAPAADDAEAELRFQTDFHAPNLACRIRRTAGPSASAVSSRLPRRDKQADYWKRSIGSMPPARGPPYSRLMEGVPELE